MACQADKAGIEASLLSGRGLGFKAGVGCGKMKCWCSSFKFYFHEFFIQDVIFKSLWLFAGLYFG